MEREEWLEWIAAIVVILLFWPFILWRWFPLPYQIFVYVFAAVVLGVTLYRRIKRVREGLDYSREILDAQARAAGPQPLDSGKQRRGK